MPLTDSWTIYLDNLLQHPATITAGYLVVGCLVLAYVGSVSWAVHDARIRQRGIKLIILAILLSLTLPFVGALLYKLFRPGSTWRQREIEASQQQLLSASLTVAEGCRQCSQSLPANAIFCPHCGERQKRTCSHCQTANALHWQYCSTCGKGLQENDRPSFVELRPGESVEINTKLNNLR